MKKKQLKITIEQKQTWQISRITESSMVGTDTDSANDDWQMEQIALLESAVSKMPISPPQIQSRGRIGKIRFALMKPINYALQLFKRVRDKN